MSAVAHALTDKDFLAAHPDDQIAYLSSIDPDFAKGKPEDQRMYLNHILAPGRLAKAAMPTEFEKERTPIGPSIGRGSKAVGSDVLSLIAGLGSIGGAAIAGQTGALEKIPQQIEQLYSADQSRKREGYGPSYRTAAGLGSIAGVDAEGMEEAARHGDTAGIVGHTIVPLAGAALGADQAITGGKGLRAIGDAGSVARSKIGGILHPPEAAGGLHPMVESFKHPLEIPGRMAGRLAEKMFPEPIEQVRARVVSKVDPFAGATSSAKPIGSAELPTPGATQLPKLVPAQAARAAFPGTPTLRPIGNAELPPAGATQLPKLVPAQAARAAFPGTPTLRPIGNAELPPVGSIELPKMMPVEQATPKQLQPAGKAASPRGFTNLGRSEPVKLENLVDQAAGVKPLQPDVPLREQLTSKPAAALEEVDPVKAKYPDPAVRQMVRANGEAIYEAAKGDPATVKAIHNLTRVDLRQALINAGEDMGQTTVSNSKFAGEGSISREEAFSRLLKKRLSPEKIIQLAKIGEGNP